MLCCIRFHSGVEDADVGVAGFGQSIDLVGVFDGDHAALGRGRVYTTNGAAGQGEMQVAPRVDHAKERCIPGPAVQPEEEGGGGGGGGGCRVGKASRGEEAAAPDAGPDYCILRYSGEDGLTS